MKNSIKITQDTQDKNLLHMEIGGTPGNNRKIVDYKNHIALLLKLNKIKRAQLEVNGKQIDIKSSPIVENNKDYVIQIRRDGDNWRKELSINGTLKIRTGHKEFLGLVEKTEKVS